MGSSAAATAQKPSAETNIIHTVMVSVGSFSVVRRIRMVPNAHDTAASCIHSTPKGRPASMVNSCATSRATALPAQAMPTSARRVKGWPKKAAARSTVQMGIVKPSVAARPEASSFTPRIENRCQPKMLGKASSSTAPQAMRGSFMLTPRLLYQSSSITVPALMVNARKYNGLSSRSANFIIGQLMPHASVRATRPISWRRVSVKPPPGP